MDECDQCQIYNRSLRDQPSPQGADAWGSHMQLAHRDSQTAQSLCDMLGAAFRTMGAWGGFEWPVV